MSLLIFICKILSILQGPAEISLMISSQLSAIDFFQPFIKPSLDVWEWVSYPILYPYLLYLVNIGKLIFR